MKFFWLILLFVFASFSVKANCLSGNCENGFGTYLYKSGDFYSGFWKNGKKHYFGMQFWKDGDFWYGLYKNGDRKPGFGIYAWDDGGYENRNNRVYFEERGCVSGNCQNGWGVFIFDDGGLNAGYWKNGKQQYLGIDFWSKKHFFVGLKKNGKRTQNPRGYYVFNTGKYKSFIGSVKYDNIGCVEGDCENGFGTYIWKNGDLHTGFWKNGKAHLIGFKFWESKDMFFGIYKNGKRQKRGIYIYETGKIDIRTDKVVFTNNDAINNKQISSSEDGETKAPSKF